MWGVLFVAGVDDVEEHCCAFGPADRQEPDVIDHEHGRCGVGLQLRGEGAVVLSPDQVLAHVVGGGEVAAVAGFDRDGREGNGEVGFAAAGRDSDRLQHSAGVAVRGACVFVVASVVRSAAVGVRVQTVEGEAVAGRRVAGWVGRHDRSGLHGRVRCNGRRAVIDVGVDGGRCSPIEASARTRSTLLAGPGRVPGDRNRLDLLARANERGGQPFEKVQDSRACAVAFGTAGGDGSGRAMVLVADTGAVGGVVAAGSDDRGRGDRGRTRR